MKTFAAGVVALAVLQAAAPAERALTAYIDAHNGEALSLLERVVDINSGTQNLAGVREVGRILRAELDALGFTMQWIDGASWQRAGHLIADRGDLRHVPFAHRQEID